MLTSWLRGTAQSSPTSDPSAQEATDAGEAAGEDSDRTSMTESQSEQFGLFPIYIPDEDNQTLPARRPYALDIVSVHGLGGDAYRTWQHRNGFNWLEHIHEELPGARVYTYGYDSGVAFSRGAGTLSDFARHLLALVRLTRKTEEVCWLTPCKYCCL